MLRQLAEFGVGIVALYFGAEWLVRGASRLARSFGMSALVVGLTVVAVGTSAPELVVSVIAAVRGQVDMTVGNIIGSNVSNIALILGCAALIHPIAMRTRLVARGIPLMIAATLVLALLLLDGRLGRAGGGVLLAGLVAYFWYLLRSSGEDPAAPVPAGDAASAAAGDAASADAHHDAYQRGRDCCPGDESRLRNVGLALAGLVLLAGGAHLLVAAATVVAAQIGLSELVIGLTVVAIGTSLPELATSILAAIRREADIAVGNAVGSNVLNILGVLGPTALLRPLSIDAAVLRFELPVMIGASLVLLPLAWTRLRLERWEGALLLAGYVTFIVLLLRRGLGA